MLVERGTDLGQPTPVQINSRKGHRHWWPWQRAGCVSLQTMA